MRTMIDRVRGALFAAGVTTALAFGARTAVASPFTPQTCTDPTAQGTCTSTSECRRICNRLSNGLIPVCDTRTYCCTCQKL
ncbi:hypothetical protein [Longimicrobium sp.]|uniref:hypothetical protein n=1 Tax=Longimicrobium sp. TaxID=2029185 RepID=UPI002E3411D4|nr:hypothetical protein [Longimicrobium sp.]HEX6040070.1 hypothetical protein [Longimicrobium sp.]